MNDLPSVEITKLRLKSNFKLKKKYQTFFFVGFLWNKEQSKRKKERDDNNNCLLDFVRGQFLDSEAKAGGIAFNILNVQ